MVNYLQFALEFLETILLKCPLVLAHAPDPGTSGRAKIKVLMSTSYQTLRSVIFLAILARAVVI